MQRVCAAVRKMKSRMKFLMVTFFISACMISVLCIQKQVFGVRNNRNFIEIKIWLSSKIEPVDRWLGSGKKLLKLVKTN